MAVKIYDMSKQCQACENLVVISLSSHKGLSAGESAHKCSLPRAFIACIHKDRMFPLYSGKPLNGTFTNSEDPDKISSGSTLF